MKIVVTGHTGFVGKHLTGMLAAAGYIVTGISRSNGYDLLRKESLTGVGEFDILIHLAAQSFVPLSFQQPHRFYEENIISTLNCLEVCRVAKAKMIFLSSYVYGQPKFLPISEVHPTHPTNPYMQSKLIGEQLCEAYHRDFQVPVSIIRPFNIYGEGQSGNFLVPTIINQLSTGTIQLQDDRPKRDFIHVMDLCEAVLRIVATNFSFSVYNIGSGQTVSIGEIVDLLVSHGFIKGNAVSFNQQQRVGEVLETRADISKAIQELNWHPQREFATELIALAKTTLSENAMQL